MADKNLITSWGKINADLALAQTREFIHPDDYTALMEVKIRARLFKCIDVHKDWLMTLMANKIYRIRENIWEPVSEPVFQYGNTLKVINTRQYPRTGRLMEIIWNKGEYEPKYYIQEEGNQRLYGYLASELEIQESPVI